MNDQTSMGGIPLSDYTRAFIEASIRKTEGAIFYTDLSNTLRDNFIHNNGQTPFFVYQGTGRETLVDDAKTLDEFRKRIMLQLGQAEANHSDAPFVTDAESDHEDVAITTPPSPMQRLLAAESRIGSPLQVKELIGSLFDGLKENLSSPKFSEFFDVEISEYPRYYEKISDEFMIRVLSREKRPDRLVTAEIKREKRKTNPWEAASFGLLEALRHDYIDRFDLELNCSLERAQIKISLIPKFRTLQRLMLVVSCAPSLQNCYVFEMIIKHPRTDWDAFSSEGEELVKRWYTLSWDDPSVSLVDKICEGLITSVENHIDETTERLADR